MYSESNPKAFCVRGGKLLKYQGPGGAVEIPPGIKEIESGAFTRCRTLAAVKIPKGAAKTGAFAFWRDRNLTIRAPAGSLMEPWARAYNIRFQALLQAAHNSNHSDTIN